MSVTFVIRVSIHHLQVCVQVNQISMGIVFLLFSFLFFLRFFVFFYFARARVCVCRVRDRLVPLLAYARYVRMILVSVKFRFQK